MNFADPKVAYDARVRAATAYTGQYHHSPIYPVRIVLVCGACSGAGRADKQVRCPDCKGSGYPTMGADQ